MNEKRKLHSDYVNNKGMTAEQEKADYLAASVKFLLQRKKLPNEILITLNNMLRQLEDKNTPPKKILRSIEAKLARITKEYSR